MAGERTVVQAAAEIRLTSTRVSQDFQQIQQRILALAQNLERQLAITIPVTLNTTSALEDLGALEALARETLIVAPVTLDTDEALDDLGALQQLGQEIAIPVSVDTDQIAQGASTVGPLVQGAALPGVRAAGAEAGRQYGTEFKRLLTVTMTAGAVATGAFVNNVLQEGFQRFTTIQDSTAALEVALDSTTAAAKLLGDTLTVVRGTPFRLDDFARAATNMVSFGVEAQKIPFYLTAIGEAAATRGSQASQYAQQLADIFGRVASVGRIYGDDILSFGSVGVNALAVLGNTFNKTTEEVRELISQGLIPADLALDALSKGILDGTTGVNGATAAFAGTMAKLGDTLSGSIENFGAARARLGVAIIDPISDTLTEMFKSLTATLDLIAPRVKAAFEALDASEAGDNFREFFADLPDMVGRAADAFEEFGDVLAPIGIAFGALGLGQLSQLLGTFGNLIPGVTGLAGALGVASGAFILLTPQLRDEVIPVLQEFGEMVIEAGQNALPSLQEAAEEAVPILAKLVEATEGLLPLADAALDLGVAVAGGLAPALDFLGDVLDKIPVEVLTSLLSVFIGFKAVTGIRSFLTDSVINIQAFGEGMIKGTGQARTGFDNLFVGAAGSLKSLDGVVGTTASAFGGFMSGMALNADDAASQITGAIGAISSVALGFAQGGLLGGAIAGAGVGLGLFIDQLQEGKRETERLAQAVSDLADTIVAEFDDELIDFKGVINSEAFGNLVDEALPPSVEKRLDDLGFKISDIRLKAEEGEDAFREWIDEIASGALRARNSDFKVGVDFSEVAAAADSFAGLEQFLKNPTFDNFGNLEQDKAARDAISAVSDEYEELFGLLDVVIPAIEEGTVKQRLYAEESADAATEAENALQNEKDAITAVGDGLLDNIDYAKMFGEESVTAAEAATLAMQRFTDELAEIGDNLSFDVQLQEFSQGLRDIGSSLSEVINQDDIDEAGRISDSITASFDRLADLRRRLVEAIQEDRLDQANIQDQIDDAAEEGRVNAEAVLRDMLANFVGDAGGVQADIDAEMAKLSELEARLNQLSTTPITLLEQVRAQAAEAGVSLYEFLLAAPTPEAQAIFQDSIVGSVEGALSAASEVTEEDGAIAGALAAEKFLGQFKDTLLAGGLDQETVDALFSDKINLDELGSDAISAQIAEIQSRIDAANSGELTPLEVKAETGIADARLDELIKFVEEHPEVPLPIGIEIGDLSELETAIENIGKAKPQGDAIKELRDLVFQGVLMPADVDLENAEAQLAALRGEETSTDLSLPIDADTSAAEDSVLALRDLVLAGATMPITISTTPSSSSQTPNFAIPGGNFNFFREGGFFGGPEDHSASIGHGIRIFREPETEGEAYVPLALARRTRSEQIMMRVADIFGFDVFRRGETPTVELPEAFYQQQRQGPAPAATGSSSNQSKIERANRAFQRPSNTFRDIIVHAGDKPTGRKIGRALQHKLMLIDMNNATWDDEF